MIYRAVRNPAAMEVAARTTSRPPGNVPYFVDNIWEWLRPDGYPSRRRAAFASPDPELAMAAAGTARDDVYQVELTEGQPACQLVTGARTEDARYHADISRLKRLLLRESLGRDWFDLGEEARRTEAALFLPCASAADIEAVFGRSRRLDADKVRGASSFWVDVTLFDPAEIEVTPHPQGEIFFEGAYRLSR